MELLTKYDQHDVDQLNLSDINKSIIELCTIWHQHAFDNEGMILDVDKISSENIKGIEDFISDKKIADSIKILIQKMEEYNLYINYSDLAGIKIGIKNTCIIYLHVKNVQSDNIISYDLNKLTIDIDNKPINNLVLNPSIKTSTSFLNYMINWCWNYILTRFKFW